MNTVRLTTFSNLRHILQKYILILLMVMFVNNLLIWLIINYIFQNPRIPQFRLICAGCQVITLLVFIIITKPTYKELGLSWDDIRKPIRNVYVAGFVFVVFMVISSYFVMWDIRYFALATNINFGLVTPVFEETIFRGYSWNKFKEQGVTDLETLVITSLFFGLFHLSGYQEISYVTQFHPEAPSILEIMITKVIFTTILGFILGLLRWKSKKLFAPIIVHALLNIVGK